jgi:hypothetical protein
MVHYLQLRLPIQLSLLLSMPIAASCLQEFDSRAAAVDPNADLPPDWDGIVTTHIETPDPLYFLRDGSSATGKDVCEATGAQAMDVLTTYCGKCHGSNTASNSGEPPYSVLDVEALKTMVWMNHPDPVTGQGFRFLAPGRPERSLIFVRVLDRTMPKQPTDVQLPREPAPSVSDTALLHHWIKSCLGSDPLGGNVPPGGQP